MKIQQLLQQNVIQTGGFVSITCKIEKLLLNRSEKSLQSDRIARQWGALFYEKGCLEMNREETLGPFSFSMVLFEYILLRHEVFFTIKIWMFQNEGSKECKVVTNQVYDLYRLKHHIITAIAWR